MSLPQGLFIFYEIGGAGGIGGGSRKKNGLNGGHLKNKGKGGGSREIFL